MISIRQLNYETDRAQLAYLDASFTTNRMYRVETSGLSWTLIEEHIDPALHKDFEFGKEVERLLRYSYVAVAEVGGAIQGIAAVNVEAWNRRAALWHLYVDRRARGLGIGRQLIDEALMYARSVGARCLWLETQNINYPAIQFYRRMGFHWCGLDTELLDPQHVIAGEVALFFARTIDELHPTSGQ